MDQATADRLRVKHPENTLYQSLREQVGLCPAQANYAVELFLAWAKTNCSEARAAGQFLRTAVAAQEPAGKPIKHCRTLEVRLTAEHRNDAGLLLAHGTEALRRVKLLRWTWETYEQGGLLSYEDLAALLVVDTSTVKRQTAKLREMGLFVPTRGAVQDIGRAPSHKDFIGRLLCRGYVYTEITAITGHSEHSIERYALDLGRVVALADQGAAPNDIRIVCNLTESTVDCYLRLYKEHNTDEFRQHLDVLKRRFESAKGAAKAAGSGQVRPTTKPSDPLKNLAARDFQQATSRLLQETLEVTPTIASHVAQKVAELNAQVFPDTKRLKPGQMVMLVESAASAPKYSGHIASTRPLIPVVLSVATSDQLDVWSSNRPTHEKRALIADALAREAQAQGGTSTIALLAVLVGESRAALGSALAQLRQEQQSPTPIQGITEDAGATLTHKEVICDLHDAGYTPPEISAIALHAPESRDRYLKTNLRVETLVKVLETIPDEVQAARFLGIRRSVVEQYLQRLQKKLAPQETPARSTAAAQQEAVAA